MKYFVSINPSWRITSNNDFSKECFSGDKTFFYKKFNTKVFDAILISKAFINKKLEEEIVEMGGVQNYFEVEKDIPVMCDCGAFTFKNGKVPFTSSELLEYYNKLGFTDGITLDSVIKGLEHRILNVDKNVLKKYRTTLDNAKSMFDEHKLKEYDFNLYGCVQGYDVKSYRNGIKELIDHGFKHIAIGGIVRQNRNLIIQIFKNLDLSDVKIHLLGISDLKILSKLKHLDSTDSQTPLMHAYKDMNRSYFCPRRDKLYFSFITIPRTNNVEIGEELVKNIDLYNHDKLTTKEIKIHIKNYITLTRDKKFTNFDKVFESINERPWNVCECEACKVAGPFILVHRSMEHSGYRAYHNLYHFYRKFKEVT